VNALDLREIIVPLAFLVIGFIAGRMSRNIEEIADAVAEEGEAVTEVVPRRRQFWTSEKVVGAFLVLLGLFTAGQGLYQDSATRRVAECTRGYANGFADALEARAGANAEAQEALDEWMTTLDRLMTDVSPGADPADARDRFRDATADYLAKRAEAKKQQAENPFPPAPRDVCN
jgi:hypothetical protein